MKFKSALITVGSGKLGGIVASHNAGGNYLRGLVIPTNPNTEYQQDVRTNLAALAGRWSDVLTAAERDAWNTYAKNVQVTDRLGEKRNLSGFQWYVACNSLRKQAGVTLIADGPNTFTMATGTEPTFTATQPTTLSVAFTNTDDWAKEVGGYLLIYASAPVSLTRNFFKGPYRYVGKVAGAASPPTSPASMTLPYQCATGQKLFFQSRILRADGRISPPFQGTDICA